MGYTFWVMADFEIGPISRIFSGLWSGFLHRTTVNELKNGFSHVFWNFNFRPKERILYGIGSDRIADFKTGPICRTFSVFWSVFFTEPL